MITTVWKKKSLKELEYLRGAKGAKPEKEAEQEEPEYASRSPQFERKKYKYLSDREFQTRKPPI